MRHPPPVHRWMMRAVMSVVTVGVLAGAPVSGQTTLSVLGGANIASLDITTDELLLRT